MGTQYSSRFEHFEGTPQVMLALFGRFLWKLPDFIVLDTIKARKMQ